MRKNHNSLLSLPPLELECMKALWALGSANVHGIRGRMWAARPLAYTTVMTIMGRLTRKGAVERRREGRCHVYRPVLSYKELRERAVTRLVDDYFLGSPEALQTYLESRPSFDKMSADEASPRLSEDESPKAVRTELRAEANGDASPGAARGEAAADEIDPALL